MKNCCYDVSSNTKTHSHVKKSRLKKESLESSETELRALCGVVMNRKGVR